MQNLEEHVHFCEGGSLAECAQQLGSDPQRGLSQAEVDHRVHTYGLNKRYHKRVSWLILFIRQCMNPFVYLLCAAAVVAVLLRDWLDVLTLSGIIILNTCLSFFQEMRAQRAVDALQLYREGSARVIRDGSVQTIEVSRLVPGDCVLLQIGDHIPADVRFIQTDSLQIDESALSGESAPIAKQAAGIDTNQVYGYQGTTVVGGSARAFVVATGNHTRFARIERLTEEVHAPSAVHRAVTRLGIFLMMLALCVLVTVFVLHLIIRGSQSDVLQLVLFSVALAVTVTPEALPVVMTFALSEGSMRLARHGVIVKRLSAIEDLGSITVLCADKTGTLTENILTVANVYSAQDVTQEDLLSFAQAGKPYAYSAHEHAVEVYIHTQALRTYELATQGYRPFDPETRMQVICVARGEKTCIVYKGAPEAIHALCGHAASDADARWSDEQGVQGRRVVAYAVCQVDHACDLDHARDYTPQFQGMIAFEDPVKSTAHEALARAQMLGVSVKIFSGDSVAVSHAIGHTLGLIEEHDTVYTGDELAAMTESDRLAALEHGSIFARMVPEQKYECIRLLGEHHLVGFLGEGVNDAPALRAAHVGIAVREATDVARDAADIILLKKSLHVLVEGIDQGRGVFANTLTYIRVSLSSIIGNFYSVAVVSLFIDYLPMLPVQIMLVNLMSDFPMVAIATDTVSFEDVRRPSSFTLRDIALFTVLFGVFNSMCDLIIFVLFNTPAAPHRLQTAWFVENILSAVLFLYSARTRVPVWRAPRPSWILATLTVLVSLCAVILPYSTVGRVLFSLQPLSLHDMLLLCGVLGVYFILVEAVKHLYYAYRTLRTRPAAR